MKQKGASHAKSVPRRPRVTSDVRAFAPPFPPNDNPRALSGSSISRAVRERARSLACPVAWSQPLTCCLHVSPAATLVQLGILDSAETRPRQDLDGSSVAYEHSSASAGDGRLPIGNALARPRTRATRKQSSASGETRRCRSPDARLGPASPPAVFPTQSRDSAHPRPRRPPRLEALTRANLKCDAAHEPGPGRSQRRQRGSLARRCRCVVTHSTCLRRLSSSETT